MRINKIKSVYFDKFEIQMTLIGHHMLVMHE